MNREEFIKQIGKNNNKPSGITAAGISNINNGINELNGNNITNADIDNTANSIVGGLNINNVTYNDIDKELLNRDNHINYNDDEKQKQKDIAKSQGLFEQLGNTAAQIFGGEVFLGTLEGFGDIIDGARFMFTGDYNESEYTKFMRENKEALKEKFKIYKEDPNATFAFGDLGWWLDNSVSTATTISLMLPGLGYAKAASGVGKITKLNKLLGWGTRQASRGISKATSKLANAGNEASRFNVLRNIAGKTGRIENTIKEFGDISATALMSRTGENFQEARQVYNDNYETALNNINNMSKDEFENFINRNPELITEDEKGNKTIPSKEEIAKRIANTTAYRTMKADYTMLLMDIMQLKALGRFWGKSEFATPKASERIAYKNLHKTLLGESDDKLIKNTFWNIQKEEFAYSFKHPLKAMSFEHISEGFEEGFQGVVSNENMDFAKRYFDPTLEQRTIGSYLTDPEIWEQAVWGSIGSVVFVPVYKAGQKAAHKTKGYMNKKNMTDEQYKAWNMSEKEIVNNRINNIYTRISKFKEDIDAIENGRNPFDYEVDPETGNLLVRRGELVNKQLSEEEKETYKQKAIDELLTEIAFDHTDNGSIDLLLEAIQDNALEKYINKNLEGVTTDTLIGKEVAERLKVINDIYNTALSNFNRKGDASNPYVTIAAAREFTRRKLSIDDLDITIDNIDKAIEEEIRNSNVSNLDYSKYYRKHLYNEISKYKEYLITQKERIENDKKINKHTKNKKIEELNKKIKDIEDICNTSLKGVVGDEFDRVDKINKLTKEIKELKEKKNTAKDEEIDSISADIINKEEELKNLQKEESYNIPQERLRELYNKKINNIITKEINNKAIPKTDKEYNDILDRYSEYLDKLVINSIDNAIEKFKKYLNKHSDNIDKAAEDFLNDDTEEAKLIKYGYLSNADVGYDKFKTINDARIDAIIEETKKKYEKDKETIEESERNGTPIPSVEDITDNTDDNTDDNSDDNTDDNSENTIETYKQKANEAVNKVKNSKLNSDTKNNYVAQIVSLDKEFELDEEGHIIDNENNRIKLESVLNKLNNIVNNINEQLAEISLADEIMVEHEEEKVNEEDVTVDNPNSDNERSRLKSEMVNMFFTEIAKNNDIVNTPDELKRKIIEEFKNKGYTDEAINDVVNDAYRNTLIAMDAFEKEDSNLKRLISEVLTGNKSNTERKAETNLLTQEELDGTIEKLIEEYAKERNIEKVNGKYIINIKSLFKHIINNDNYTTNDIIDFYNKIIYYINNGKGNVIFTGYTINNIQISANQFVNDILKEDDNLINDKQNSVHINVIEEENRDSDFYDAMSALGNDAQAYAKLEKGTKKGVVVRDGIQTTERIDVDVDIAIYVKFTDSRGNIKNVKIGTLRTVDSNSNGTSYKARKHYSGFSFECRKDANGHIIMDGTDKFFYGIFNKTSAGIDIYKCLLEYLANRKANLNNPKAAMTEELAHKIINNPLVQELLSSGEYKFFTLKRDEVSKAIELASTVSNILFYDDAFRGMNMSTDYISNLNADENYDMEDKKKSYENFKVKVYSNYTYTYNIEQHLNDGNHVIVDVANPVAYITMDEEDENNYHNIADMDFKIENTHNSRHRYNPLVYVDSNGHVIDEYDRDYGIIDKSIKNNIGHIIYNKNGKIQIAWYYKKKDDNIKTENKDLYRAITEEVVTIIKNHLGKDNNILNEKGNINISDIISDINDLFNYNGIFKFPNIKIYNNETGITILKNDKPIITFNSKIRHGRVLENMVNIQIYDENGKRGPVITNINSTFNRQQLSNAFNIILQDVKINKSVAIASHKFNSKYVNTENRFVTINIGNYHKRFNSYADFLIQNRAFVTNKKLFKENKSNPYVMPIFNENKLTIDYYNANTTEKYLYTYTSPYDLLYPNTEGRQPRSTVDIDVILRAANISENAIRILLGDNEYKLSLLSKLIRTDDSMKAGVKAEYRKKGKNSGIFISKEGARDMTNSENALRLIIHENIHRLFNDTSNISKTKRRKAVNDLFNLCKYTIETIKKDDRISDSFKERMLNLFSKYDINTTDIEQKTIIAEEFLAESLSQREFMRYLNSTNYAEVVSIDIEENKTIFQKIIDILAKLFGINIKDNTILAKEFEIFSNTLYKNNKRNNTKTDDTKTNNTEPTKTDNNKLPVGRTLADNPTLQLTIDKVNEIENKMSIITRSDNFEEDHTYYVNGEKVDTSVTSLIHKDDGPIPEEYSTASSAIGNTLDKSGRDYYEKGEIDENTPNLNPNIDNVAVPGTVNGLKHDFDLVKEELDKKFGKDRYKIITKEFPIGARYTENGVEKTIAGTMDMIVVTDTGDIYIYDFKTSRSAVDGKKKLGYTNQVNLYRRIIETNFPELEGKVHVGGLIVFKVGYTPSKDYKVDNNGQLTLDGKNIQDDVNYQAPTIYDFNNPITIIDENDNFNIELSSIIDNNSNNNSNDNSNDNISTLEEDAVNIENLDDLSDDLNFENLSDDYDTLEASTELLVNDEIADYTDLSDNETTTEIYTESLQNNQSINPFGIQINSNMDNFISMFDISLQANIRRIMDNGELNYTCR